MKSFPFFSFPFLSNPLFSRMMNIFENTNITEDADNNKKVSLTTSVDDVTFTTVIGVDGDVLFKANVSATNRDDKNSIVNILLSKAEDVLVNCSPSVKVELTIDDKTYKFSGVCENENNVAFVTTNDEGVTGYMYHLATDDNYIKEWFFTDDLYVAFGKKRENEPCCDCPCYDFNDCEVVDESPITTEQPNDPVDETHVYTDDEMHSYANFMCNVVCGGCNRSSCDGCSVVGQSNFDNAVVIPDNVDDKDFAKFIKDSNKNITRYLNHEEFMNNLRNVLLNGNYIKKDDSIIVLFEDIINTDNDYHDIVSSILDNEYSELNEFLKDATNRFGFASATYERDNEYSDEINLRFYLPE